MSDPQTLLGTVQTLKLGPPVTHLFASSSEVTCNLLQDVIHTADQVANSLAQYLAMPTANPKLVSQLRQHAMTLHSLHTLDQNMQKTTEKLRERSGIIYGEDIPLDRVALVEWCISRFESWGTAAGMETFKDEGREGGVSLVLGGKVLVVDVDFSIDRSTPLAPVIDVASVKTSYAIQNAESGSSNADGSISLDGFLTQSMKQFCKQVQKGQESQDPIEAAVLGAVILNQLKYLVTLDRLAHRKEDGGIRWFVDVDQLCSILEGFARSESTAIASSLSLGKAPLDIFLHRSHSLPLPYLTFPSISFLTYLSPRAYLSLLRTMPTESSEGPSETLPVVDIPFVHLRSWLSVPRQGVTLATLKLSPPSEAHLFPPSMSMPTLTTRPTFYMVPAGSELEHILPQTADLSSAVDPPLNDNGTLPDQHSWMLDFTDGGKSPGVVMSQSRMRDVELVVNPLSGMDQFDQVSVLPYGTASWVDLLLNPANPLPAGRYISLYKSPSSAHPPVNLRLTSPEEPGFLLERVPVHSMKEVWGVLEVVREQCWLNETLLGCQWSVEGTSGAEDLPDDPEVSEADLEALLSGNIIPRKIPVNVFLPSQISTAANLFEATEQETDMHIQARRPRILMASPERSPMTGLVGVTVTYDETRPRGITIHVSGALGADLHPDSLEEICRRGGIFSIPGRIWARSSI